jgi:hypothetical protein
MEAILKPPQAITGQGASSALKQFQDIYIVAELMESDLHRIIYSKQQLSEDHVQYFVYQVAVAVTTLAARH